MSHGWFSSAARRSIAGAAVLLVLFFAASAGAQNFGQNKVQYEKFDFQVLKTDHFDIYYYPEEAKPAQEVARMAERWYVRISTVLGFELRGRQPIILYASHPNFAQTNVVEGIIDEGVGGVTEGLMRRVTLPLAATMGETDHVLGHELVHAFQFDALGLNGESLPLWFIEGMAEYISVGPRDVQTAMWLRDAVIEKRVPSISQLNDPRYFPYRFGQAFWAYMGGKWGDEIMGRILKGVAVEESPARGDAEIAIEMETGVKIKALSEDWQGSVASSAQNTIDLATPLTNSRVIGKDTGSGSLNVGPSISPDGKRIAFLSARDRLSIDLFVADTSTGKVTAKLINTASDPHFDSLQFLASAGSWDPEGRLLAIATLRRGRPVLAIVDVEKKRVAREVELPELGEVYQPAWSPDGQYVAFSAQVGGVTDLFVYDLVKATTTRLTNDMYADLQPAWSPLANQLTFVTDRFTSDVSTLSYHGYELATISTDGSNITRVEVPLTGDVTNPQWSGDGASLYFMSNHGGRPNVYRMNEKTHEVVMLTNVATGVAGITPLSPALSISRRGDIAGVSVFRDGGYDVAILQAVSGAGTPPLTDGGDAAILPPETRGPSQVAELLDRPAFGLPDPKPTEPEPYKPGLHLLSIGQQISVATTSAFGSYAAGGLSFLFSDTLGDHILGVGFGINGGIRDISTRVQYLNRASRWTWSTFIERVPIVTAIGGQGVATQSGRPIVVDQLEVQRQTFNIVGGTVAYPFDRALRVEFGASAQHIGFDRELQTQTYDLATGIQLTDDRVELPSVSSLNLFDTSAALVRDTTAFGAVGPVQGMRARVEVAPTFGDLRYVSTLVDFRRYFMPLRPITLAGRALHVARYGPDSEDPRLFPLYLGYPSLVRGYDSNSFDGRECTPTPNGSCPEVERLYGSRILVLNGEVRVPMFGLATGKLSYGPIPAEVFLFFDSGLAWNSYSVPSRQSNWITSAGAGVRVNALGFAILEFNAVRPFDRPLEGWTFVFNLRSSF